MQAQVQVHELADLRDRVGWVPQRPEARLGHLGPHHLMVVERHALGGELPGPRLADVVQEGGEAQHQVRTLRLQGDGVVEDGERVGEDVLVPVDGVLLQPQQRQLGDELGRQPDLGRQRQCGGRRPPEEQLGELLADALRRDDRQAPVQLPDGGDHAGIDGEVQGRGEA